MGQHHPEALRHPGAAPPLGQALNGRKAPEHKEPIAERITAGNRHASLLRVAGAMRRQGAGFQEIHAALTVMNENRCDPPKPAGVVEELARDVTARYTPEADLELRIPALRDDQGPLPILTLAELGKRADDAGPRRYLIRGIWAADTYGVLAGPMKAQKTMTMADAAVSVASGTPWLGHFPIDDPGPVLMFAGEGGDASIVRRLRGVCDSRDLDPDSLPVHICTRAPHLRSDEHMGIFTARVAEIGPKLVILDPLYLSAVGAKSSDLRDGRAPRACAIGL